MDSSSPLRPRTDSSPCTDYEALNQSTPSSVIHSRWNHPHVQRLLGAVPIAIATIICLSSINPHISMNDQPMSLVIGAFMIPVTLLSYFLLGLHEHNPQTMRAKLINQFALGIFAYIPITMLVYYGVYGA